MHDFALLLKQAIERITCLNGSIIIHISIATDPVAASTSLPTIEQSLFCRITQAAYNEGKAQAVEEELKGACSSAPRLIKAIRFNESMGYLDTQNLSSAFFYRLLDEHYGLPFKPRCFRYYRSKAPT